MRTALPIGLRRALTFWRRSIQARVVASTLVLSAIVISAVGWFLLQQTRDGLLRRWDGFIARGEGAAEAARLEAENRFAELDAALPARREAAASAEATQRAAQDQLAELQRSLVALGIDVGDEHVLDVDHSDHLIEALAVDRKAAVTGIDEGLD